MFIDNAINNLKEVNYKLKELSHFEPLPELKERRIPCFIANKQYHVLLKRMCLEVELACNFLERSQERYFVDGNPNEILEERFNRLKEMLLSIKANHSIDELEEAIQKEEYIKKIEEIREENNVKGLSLDEIKYFIENVQPVDCDDEIKKFVNDRLLSEIKHFTEERVKFFENI